VVEQLDLPPPIRAHGVPRTQLYRAALRISPQTSAGGGAIIVPLQQVFL